MSDANGFFSKVKSNWGIIVALCGLFAWIIAQVINVTYSISAANASIDNNKQDIEATQTQMAEHKSSETGHYKLSERMIKVETDVNHINITQTTNFKDIKDQLKVIQADVKDLGKR